MLEGKYLKSADFEDFLRGLNAKMLGQKWGLFLDNASIHKSAWTRGVLNSLPGPSVPTVYNLVSRPDLNGIEIFWRYAKQMYRSTIDGHKVNGREWD